MSASPTSAKKTVYVDVDEEITGIIDKVRTTNESIVALVLPKRATVLQSIVNMKLLKRAANQSDKKIVLITSESTLLPLAGVAGIHVAANLQSRPYIPAAPDLSKADAPTKPVEMADEDEDAPIDPQTPIGDLATAKAADKVKPIEIDNRPKAPASSARSTASAAAAPKPKKDKSKKIPDFKKFRVLLLAGGGVLLLLIFGLYWAFAVAPKATVTLRTESSETQVSALFTADTDAEQINLDSDIVPAKSKELKKTETEKVPASGEKDNGTKAGGMVTLRNCTDPKVTIPAGTGVSNGSQTFITQNAVNLGKGKFSSANSGSQCSDDPSDGHMGSVNVIAQNNGEEYNLSARTYTVSGFSGVVAQGDQMTGGTSKKVKVVAQADVDAAKKKISDKQNAAVDQLKTDLKDSGYVGLVDTFSAGPPTLAATPAVGAESPDVTVAGEVVYTMLGIKEGDLKKIIEDQAKGKVDTSKQTILNYGLDDATYEVGTKKGSNTGITLNTTLVAGPEVNQDALKSELAGKKKSDAEAQLKGRPGITEAKVEFKPFWVSKVPGKASKVTFVIEQANGKPVTP